MTWGLLAKIICTVVCVAMFIRRVSQDAREYEAAIWLIIVLAFWSGVLVGMGDC